MSSDNENDLPIDRIINDNVFGMIQIKPYISEIIDTKEFQRLRFITRLGLVQFVYPSATHTVFMSSIGRYYLVKKFVKKIQHELTITRQKKLTLQEIICIEIAALCSDIAYVPFRYFWDRSKDELNLVIKNPRESFRKIWDEMRKNEKIEKILNEYKINNGHHDLIEALVKGDKSRLNGEYSDFMFQIVYNADNRMDIILWERLCRDNIQLGHKSTNFLIEVKRFIKLAKVIDGKLCFRNKCFQSIIDAYRLWGNMHETAYRHRVVESIEQVLIDAFQTTDKKSEINEFSRNIMKSIDGDFYNLIYKIGVDDKIFNRKLFSLELEAMKLANINEQEKDRIKLKIREQNDKNAVKICVSFINLATIMSIDSIKKIMFYDKHQRNGFYLQNEYFKGIELHFTQSRILFYFKTANTEHNPVLEACEKILRDDGWILSSN